MEQIWEDKGPKGNEVQRVDWERKEREYIWIEWKEGSRGRGRQGEYRKGREAYERMREEWNMGRARKVVLLTCGENGEAQEKGETLSNARPDASMMSGDDREG